MDESTRPASSAIWLWSGRGATAALAHRDLGVTLRTYRQLNGLSQEKLAALLGYDKTYVSLIENRRRTIGDVTTLRHIANVLGIPAHVLGVTDNNDADFTAMLQFGDSTIRLAEIARQAGRAMEAVDELWPLVARLEARAAEGYLERNAIVLLGRARAVLGVALGDVLPEERLAVAAKWTGKALLIASRLGDPSFHARVLRMHGNELRKAEHRAAAIARLEHAVALSTNVQERGAALAQLARATGEFGDPHRFDQAMIEYRTLLDHHEDHGTLFNAFTLREIQLRGLISTGRSAQAAQLAHDGGRDMTPAAPQWHVIERVTAGHAYLAVKDRVTAEKALQQAITNAQRHRLPHQIQRIIRIARQGGLYDLATAADSVLRELRTSLALPQGRGSQL
jgi:transcriptional regulator with XRE-family HTH domain